MRHFRTCPLCEAVCGLAIDVEDGRITAIRGDDADPFSKGHICPKGVALQDVHSDPDRLRTWALALEGRSHHNKATVALANKLARIAWAVSVKDTDYRSVPAPKQVA